MLAKPGGVTATTTYDPLGNPTRLVGAGASVATPDRVVGYDLLSRPASVNAPGGTNTIAYDDRGNVVSTTGPSGTSSFTWDADGHQSTAVTAAGTASFSYDAAGRLATAADPLTGATSTYGYDNAGALTSIGYGTGAATRTFTYDALRRLDGDTVAAPGGGTTSSATYDYDLDDRLTGRTTVAGGTTVAETFGYDRADRLISRSDGSATTAYTWDAANNLLNDSAVVNARNQLLSRAGTTYTYTPRGTLASRTTAGATVTQAFNAFDELVTDGATTYTYDGFNRLIGAGARSLTYLGTSDTVTGDGTFSYTATPDGTPLGARTGGPSSIVRTDPHTDLVGTFNPATGAVTGTRRYDPFGAVVASTGVQPSLGYQHQWTDPTSGNVDMGARWYQPATGTFASRDPYPLDPRDINNANRFAYAAANPLTNTDPTGHFRLPSSPVNLPDVDVDELMKRLSSAASETAKTAGTTVRTTVRTTAKVARRGNPVGWLVGFVADAPSTVSGCRDVLYQPNGQPCPQYAAFLARRGATKTTTYSGSRYNDERYDRIGSSRSAPGRPARPGTGRSGNGSAPEAHYGGATSRVLANALRPAARPPLTATVAAHIQAAFDAAFNAPPVDLGILTGDDAADDPFTPTTAQTGPGLPAPLNIWVDDACATGGQWTTIDGITHTKTSQVLECDGSTPQTETTESEDAARARTLKGPIADQVARNLPEQIALESARAGTGELIMRKLGDAPRLTANYGPGEWVKMQSVLRGIDENVTVHWFRNMSTGASVEFKFTKRYGD